MPIEAFKKQFEKTGLIFTSQRKTIAKVLLGCGSHPDVDEIYNKVKEIDKGIGIATVYRTVSLFAELGLIERRDFKDGKSRYEFKQEHHNHIILKSGEVIEFQNAELEIIINKIVEEKGLLLDDYIVEIYCIKK